MKNRKLWQDPGATTDTRTRRLILASTLRALRAAKGRNVARDYLAWYNAQVGQASNRAAK